MKKLTVLLSTLNVLIASLLISSSDNDKFILYFVLSLCFWIGVMGFIIMRKFINWLSR